MTNIRGRGGFSFGRSVDEFDFDDEDRRVRTRPELRGVREPRETEQDPLPEPRVKARKIRFTLIEATQFLSTMTPIGGTVQNPDLSLEGQIELWRQTSGEKEFHDWDHIFDGTTHYFIIRWTE
jgi:hypothetical protein